MSLLRLPKKDESVQCHGLAPLTKPQLKAVLEVFAWLMEQPEAFEEVMAKIEWQDSKELGAKVKTILEDDGIANVRTYEDMLYAHDILRIGLPVIGMMEAISKMRGETVDEDVDPEKIVRIIDTTADALAFCLSFEEGIHADRIVKSTLHGLEDLGVPVDEFRKKLRKK